MKISRFHFQPYEVKKKYADFTHIISLQFSHKMKGEMFSDIILRDWYSTESFKSSCEGSCIGLW